MHSTETTWDDNNNNATIMWNNILKLKSLPLTSICHIWIIDLHIFLEGVISLPKIICLHLITGCIMMITICLKLRNMTDKNIEYNDRISSDIECQSLDNLLRWWEHWCGRCWSLCTQYNIRVNKCMNIFFDWHCWI